MLKLNYRPILMAFISLFFSVFAFSQEKRALLVGISDYESSPVEYKWNDIHGTNDVGLLVPELVEHGFLSVETLLDAEATFSRISGKMESLIASAGEGDLVYVHFSCHGQPVLDLDGDEPDGWDESVIPYDASMFYEEGMYEGENHITDDLIGLWIKRLRSKVGNEGMVYVVLDSCYSGTGSRDPFEDESHCRGVDIGFDFGKNELYSPTLIKKVHYALENAPGYGHVVVLEACRSYQQNREIRKEEKFYGPLSFHIYKSLTLGYDFSQHSFAGQVIKSFNGDSQILGQDIVYETTLENDF